MNGRPAALRCAAGGGNGTGTRAASERLRTAGTGWWAPPVGVASVVFLLEWKWPRDVRLAVYHYERMHT